MRSKGIVPNDSHGSLADCRSAVPHVDRSREGNRWALEAPEHITAFSVIKIQVETATFYKPGS